MLTFIVITITFLAALCGYYSTYFKARKALQWEMEVDEIEAWKAEKARKMVQYEAWKKSLLTLKVSDFGDLIQKIPPVRRSFEKATFASRKGMETLIHELLVGMNRGMVLDMMDRELGLV